METNKNKYQPCVITSRRVGLGEIQDKSQAIKSVETLLSSLPRIPQTAVRQESWCVTSIRAAVMAASSTMSSTASWSPMAPSARSSWNLTTGATPLEAGRPFFCPSATPALTAQELPLDTGQVRTSTLTDPVSCFFGYGDSTSATSSHHYNQNVCFCVAAAGWVASPRVYCPFPSRMFEPLVYISVFTLECSCLSVSAPGLWLRLTKGSYIFTLKANLVKHKHFSGQKSILTSIFNTALDEKKNLYSKQTGTLQRSL